MLKIITACALLSLSLLTGCLFAGGEEDRIDWAYLEGAWAFRDSSGPGIKVFTRTTMESGEDPNKTHGWAYTVRCGDTAAVCDSLLYEDYYRLDAGGGLLISSGMAGSDQVPITKIGPDSMEIDYSGAVIWMGGSGKVAYARLPHATFSFADGGIVRVVK